MLDHLEQNDKAGKRKRQNEEDHTKPAAGEGAAAAAVVVEAQQKLGRRKRRLSQVEHKARKKQNKLRDNYDDNGDEIAKQKFFQKDKTRTLTTATATATTTTSDNTDGSSSNNKHFQSNSTQHGERDKHQTNNEQTPESEKQKKKEKKRKKKRKKKRHCPKDTNDETRSATETETDSNYPDTKPSFPMENDYQSTYIATPIPSFEDLKNSHGAKPLGKWFPKAVVIKAKEPPLSSTKASLVLFYQYVDPLWPESVTRQLISYLLKIAQARALGGRIRVAREGINATVSSRDTETSTAAATLRHFSQDLQSFFHRHATMTKAIDFKFIDHLSGDRHFKDFKVFPVQELVYYGGLDGEAAPLKKGGIHLSAQEFHSKLTEQNTVVVDVRNHYEAAIGRFDGQTVLPLTTTTTTKADRGNNHNDKINSPDGATPSFATYVDPKMRKSTDFTAWLQKPETCAQLAGKQVLLYCTGGVRCERASAYLNQRMGEQLQGVYQLKGGIERYLQEFPNGGYWRGKNFVFDKREAFAAGNPDGDGGVLHHQKSKKGSSTALPEMKCCVCDKPWDRYVGKKKCGTCGVPVLMCESCLSSTSVATALKMAKDNNQPPALIRCPLCVEENITIPVADVDWTDNGVTPVCVSTSTCDNGKAATTMAMTAAAAQKAAPSVLKWGGGHAAHKKERRRLQRIPCKFGASCKRSECYFAHPSSSVEQRPEEKRTNHHNKK